MNHMCRSYNRDTQNTIAFCVIGIAGIKQITGMLMNGQIEHS